MRAIGIDLGTTNSVVAYIAPNGKPEVIRDAEGRNTVPSVISFEEATPVVGHDAKELQSQGASDVVAFFKRSIGDAHFEVQFHGQRYTAIDLSALVLGKLKAQAEAFLHEPVTDAVITVPAYFTNPERQATIEAGRRAGLNVLAIINEPTAAALAYGLRSNADAERTVLVYDLGGGTFDITVVQITPTDLNVIATDGDHALGGKDWDERLILYLQSQFQQEFGVDLLGDNLSQLLVDAEQLKKTLTARHSGSIRIQAAGHAATYTVTREQFANLTQDLLERTRYLTEQVLAEAGFTWAAISGVLPVGGSTRMPMVREMIERISGKVPMSGINEDEAVALGAAIKASMETAPQMMLLGSRRTRDVMAHSLGMIAESEDRARYLNSILIKKNLAIPSKETRPYTMQMRRDGGTTMEVFLTQGETDDPQDSVYLGTYTFSNFPVAQGQVVVDVTYAYDANGVVDVSAVERSTGQPLTLTVGPVPPDVPARFLKKPSEVAQASREHMTIYLAFDLSGSMTGAPLDEAKEAALSFVQQCDLSITSIGLIGFSDSVQMYQKVTQDVNKITAAIRSLSIGPTGYGNAGHPFDMLFNELAQVPGIHYGIVLADGVWSHQDLAIRQAKRCHQAQIDIIAIGFGEADEAFLRAIASTSEGSIFTHQGRLEDTFSTIARELTESGGQGRGNRGLRA